VRRIIRYHQGYVYLVRFHVRLVHRFLRVFHVNLHIIYHQQTYAIHA